MKKADRSKLTATGLKPATEHALVAVCKAGSVPHDAPLPDRAWLVEHGYLEQAGDRLNASPLGRELVLGAGLL